MRCITFVLWTLSSRGQRWRQLPSSYLRPSNTDKGLISGEQPLQCCNELLGSDSSCCNIFRFLCYITNNALDDWPCNQP